jgi:hypothetical protein
VVDYEVGKGFDPTMDSFEAASETVYEGALSPFADMKGTRATRT